MLLNLIIDLSASSEITIRLRQFFFKINIIMEIENLTKQIEKKMENKMTGLLGMIWKIKFWNMKKIR